MQIDSQEAMLSHTYIWTYYCSFGCVTLWSLDSVDLLLLETVCRLSLFIISINSTLLWITFCICTLIFESLSYYGLFCFIYVLVIIFYLMRYEIYDRLCDHLMFSFFFILFSSGQLPPINPHVHLHPFQQNVHLLHSIPLGM